MAALLEQPNFRETITCSDEFDFKMTDIERMRRDMITLIERLSKIYADCRSASIDQKEKIEKGKK